ncbi:unnamed protein product [Euphydryas editha]|uniref:Uncharacterized protein n=1 Tax=Euphydryas editha TaxID=104508 RepID=A0AAU9UIY0_EUPED|nr:unnamed protein product [Euphydryas editha]
MDRNTRITVNVLQWNAQSIRPKSTELEALLNQEKIHIAVISETWLFQLSLWYILKGNKVFRDVQVDLIDTA